LVSQPFLGLLSQSPNPELHARTPHMPAVHAGCRFGMKQSAPVTHWTQLPEPSQTEPPL
jgi:hypothetical protein